MLVLGHTRFPNLSFHRLSLEEVRFVKLLKNIRFGGSIFPHDCLMSSLRPHREFDGELVRTGCEAFPVACGHTSIRCHWLSRLCINPFFNMKRPKQLRDRVEKVSIRKVDPGAQSPAIAYIAC